MDRKDYQVYVDLVTSNEDWEDDSKIKVVDMAIAANNAEEARYLAVERVAKEYPEYEFYVWEVTENDALVTN